MGCVGCVLCQKRLRLSSRVDECKPLPAMCRLSSARRRRHRASDTSERTPRTIMEAPTTLSATAERPSRSMRCRVAKNTAQMMPSRRVAPNKYSNRYQSRT
jgi:hypothetical protein